MKHLLTAATAALLSVSLYACAPAQSAETPQQSTATSQQAAAPKTAAPTTGPKALYKSTRKDGLKEMIVAGGCFWCVESDFEKVDGVRKVISGYTGGTVDNPTYKIVTGERSGHFEAAKIIYDPSVVTYSQLLDYYWRHVDPTDPRGQFCDKGPSYTTAIFATPEQYDAAVASKANIEKTKPFSADIVTPILPAVTFYDAEKYHQDYHDKNPVRYNYYRKGCGRDARVKQLWGGT